jgi:prepilin-type N-terminal cleavage/methylation domain-containing protein
MAPDGRSGSDQSGFTLIEVLVALVILAVGLLALEALGIYAARSVSLAQRQSTYALTASQHLEAAVDSVERAGASFPCGTSSWPDAETGDVVRRDIQGAVNRRNITVEVLPATGSGLVRPDTFTLVTDVFVPNAPSC